MYGEGRSGDDLFVTVARDPFGPFGVLKVYLLNKGHGGNLFIARPDKDSMGITVWTRGFEVKAGEITEPSLTIPSEYVPALLQALSNAGIKLPEKSFLEGKLEAQTEHLKDIRTILEKRGVL